MLLDPHRFTGTQRNMGLTLCLQTPTGLWNCRHLPRSPPGHLLAPHPESPCSLPKSFPSPNFSFGDPRAASSATFTARLWSWLILLKRQPEFGLAAPPSLQTPPSLPATTLSSLGSQPHALPAHAWHGLCLVPGSCLLLQKCSGNTFPKSFST